MFNKNTSPLLLVKQSVFAMLCAASAGALADPSPALDRFSLSAGGYYVDPTFRVGVNTPYGRADTGDLDRDHTTLGRVRAEMLFFDHQGLSFDYYHYDNDFNASIAQSGTVGGVPVTAAGSAAARLKVDLAQLAYKWWIGSGNTVFGIGVGAGYYRGKVNYTASGSVGGIPGSASGSSDGDAFAPLLELGWRTALSNNLRLYAEASGIKKNGGNLNGHIYNGAIGVEWFPFKNVGVAADYGISKILLHRDIGSSDADLNIKLVGPSAYIKVRF
ncbi:MAG TPA: hypothetical protein VGN04_11355 [Herbaspirillum sp.]|jgi:hypothetical protein